MDDIKSSLCQIGAGMRNWIYFGRNNEEVGSILDILWLALANKAIPIRCIKYIYATIKEGLHASTLLG
jgi:hypothetical protein